MFKFGASAAVSLLLFFGCSSAQKKIVKAPALPAQIETWAQGKDPQSVENRIQELYRANPTEEMEWWATYQIAKIWTESSPAKSCANFKKLAGTEKFPLSKIALLRSLETCPTKEKDLPPLEEVLTKTNEPWLQELLRTTVLHRAAMQNKRSLEMKLNAEMAAYADLQSQKVAYLGKAIALAEQLNKTKEEAEFRARLIKIAPRFTANPKPEQFLAVAGDLRQARKFSEARTMYKRVLHSSEFDDSEKYRALDGIRLAYKNERDDKYVDANKDMVEFAKKRIKQTGWFERYFDSSLMLARAIWTERTQEEAKKVLNKLEKHVANKKSLDEINWIRARMEEENGKFSEAVAILQNMNAGNASRDLNEKIAWYRAWNLRKVGRHDEAIEALYKMNEDFAGTTSRSRNRFWAAKSLLALDKKTEANHEFEELIYSDPLSYYAQLSYRELGRDLPAKNSEHENETDQLEWPGELEWMISLAENRVAQDFLDEYVKNHPQKAPNTPEGRELLKHYARAGNYKALFGRMSGFPSEVRDKIIDEEPSLLFPQPYGKFVPIAGKRFGVYPELIYSIMRQESSFDPYARSAADAFGLLQLIPEAAKRTERLTGIQIHAPEDLYNPHLNIPVGAAFLRILMDQFDDQFIPTVASYNASEKAILNWIKTRYRGDSLEFIEDIPYDETRNYVKLVMRNYIFYLRINSEGRDVAFPEWCLESLQPPIL